MARRACMSICCNIVPYDCSLLHILPFKYRRSISLGSSRQLGMNTPHCLMMLVGNQSYYSAPAHSACSSGVGIDHHAGTSDL